MENPFLSKSGAQAVLDALRAESDPAEAAARAASSWAKLSGAELEAAHALCLSSLVCDGGEPFLSALIAAGADPSACGSDGYSPLMEAAMAGNASCAKILLEAGADPSPAVGGALGWTPLFCSVCDGHRKLSILLAKALPLEEAREQVQKAYLNAQRPSGRTLAQDLQALLVRREEQEIRRQCRKPAATKPRSAL